MPAYDFRCTACRHTFEVIRPSGMTVTPECPECGSDTKRVFTPIGVHFKGSGFYNTDYKGKNPAAKPAETKAADAPACPSSGGSGCAGCPAAAASGD